MGIGKLARGLGKVGALIEGLGYVLAAGKAVVRAVKGKRSEDEVDQPADLRQDDEGGQQPVDRA